MDDADVEGSETVGLSLTNATGGATLGATDTATLTITDNDTNPDETDSPIRIEAENYDTSNTDVTVYTTTDEKWSGHSVSLWHNSDLHRRCSGCGHL